MSLRWADGRWRADVATVLRDVGSLLAMEALLMTVSVVVAAGFAEWHVALAFLVAGGLTAAVGLGLRTAFAGAGPPTMKHGMVVAAAGWLAVAAFGAAPFLLAAHLTPPAVAAAAVPAGAGYESSLLVFRDPLHALFESTSGWTGSGLTMAAHEPTLPRGIQWWRSLTQWVGGVGVIVLTVSILARPGSGSYALYRAEGREEKIHPSVVSTVRTVWRIFLAYTLLSVGVLFVAIRTSEYGAALSVGEQAWQALNHAMTGLSTGGFSVTDDSVASYGSPFVEGVLLPVMALGAVAFPVHYAVVSSHDPSRATEDLQTRWLSVALVVGTLLLAGQNLLALPWTAGAFVGDWVGPTLGGVVAPVTVDALRDSTFQFVSALTCTGFQSAPIGRWSDGGKLLVAGAMTLGGSAGSTVGGIKIVRAYTVTYGVAWRFRRGFLPESAVYSAEIGDRHLSRTEMEREFAEAAIVLLLWLLLAVASSLVLANAAAPDVSYVDALFEVASAQGNVGLSVGITGPSMPPVAEAMFLFNMWAGRLEIVPVFVFLRAALYGLDP
jgi:trk system potassium uptake protein TrkH